jgi:hypothetical protein
MCSMHHVWSLLKLPSFELKTWHKQRLGYSSFMENIASYITCCQLTLSLPVAASQKNVSILIQACLNLTRANHISHFLSRLTRSYS